MSPVLLVKELPVSRGSPAKKSSPKVDPEVRPYLEQLERSLALEMSHRGSAQPARPSPDAGTITCGMRDGSAHVLRCLKVWYDLPSDVFFGAVSFIDRFLAKMKAQPKHLSCIAVSAFHLACVQHQHYLASNNQVDMATVCTPDPSDLVSISQSRCSPSDLLRMQRILADKLGLAIPKSDGTSCQDPPPVTPLSLLRLMFAASKAASVRLGLPDLLPATLPDNLVHKLEILVCDSQTLSHRPSEVALALLASDFRRRASVSPAHATALLGFVSELQRRCAMPSESFQACLGQVVDLLDRYNGEGTVAHRQRLVWKLSNRTLRHLRPTDKLRATLPTIKERVGVDPNDGGPHRLRSNSECSDDSMGSFSSECDESDASVSGDSMLMDTEE